LISDADARKAYLSFPITRLKLRSDTQLIAAVDKFKLAIGQVLIAFDPYRMSEYNLVTLAETARKDSKKELTVTLDGAAVVLSVEEVLALKHHLEGQILARDFALIDQSDMIVAYFVLDEKGVPEISAGSQTELAYAFGLTKETYVICEAPGALSPWVTNHATKVFTSVEDAEAHLIETKEGTS
jgi:adenylate kinase